MKIRRSSNGTKPLLFDFTEDNAENPNRARFWQISKKIKSRAISVANEVYEGSKFSKLSTDSKIAAWAILEGITHLLTAILVHQVDKKKEMKRNERKNKETS